MIKYSFLITLFSVFCVNINAKNIELEALGKLTLKFQPVENVNYVPGANLIGQVDHMVGHDYLLNTPVNISKLLFVLDNGSKIKKGEEFAKISGPDVHHFMAELNAKTQLLSLATKRLENSRQLFNQKLIDEDKWLQINKNYFSSQLEFEHLQHFAELIKGEIVDDTVTLVSPIDGLYIKGEQEVRFNEGDILASFVSTKQIKIKAQLPSKQANNVDYLQLENCRLKVENKARVSSGAFVEVWSEMVKENCQLLLGDRVTIKPFYKKDAYKIKKDAVLNFEGNDYIFLKNNNQLELIEVELLTFHENHYLFTSSTDLSEKQILVSSVSAVQGILLGLGGE